jgi:two-component system response regulator
LTESIIVLVEDNAGDEALTLRALKQNNILNDVVVLRDGAEAIEYFFGQRARAETPPQLPQIVLLDLNLPKIGGLDVLRRLREEERTKLLPVIILTSSKEERDVAAGYDLGANSYIVKPVDFTQFSAAVRQLGLYWLVLNQPPPLRIP